MSSQSNTTSHYEALDTDDPEAQSEDKTGPVDSQDRTSNTDDNKEVAGTSGDDDVRVRQPLTDDEDETQSEYS